jgi:hypothetical protein
MPENIEDSTRPRPEVVKHDTQPIRYRSSNEVPPPPRFLFWSVIGLFVLAIVGTIAGIIIFRNVLQPGQQQRVINIVPFMQAFLPPHPAADDTLPTPEAVTGNPEDLLNLDFGASATEESTPEVTEEPTEVSVLPPTATPTVEVTATFAPTTTPQATATFQPTVQQVNVSAPTVQFDRSSAARLTGFTYTKQGWNNCGPANITMALSYYGWQQSQDYAAQFLKPADKEDKNVSPREMVTFVNERSQVRAITRIGGNINMLKTFISNKFPVIIETGYMPEGYDWMGHYQTVVGYDDSLNTFYLYDSYLGQGESGEGLAEAYNSVDRMWQHFNRTFIVIYEPSREDLVRAILGELADPAKAAEHAYSVAQTEAQADPQNPFVWFNMGTALVELGDYERAATAYAQATRSGAGLPWRMLWYQFGPYEAFFNIGHYEDVLSYVATNLENGGEYVEETYYWQGKALAALGRPQEAATSFRAAIRRNPSFQAATQALADLGL